VFAAACSGGDSTQPNEDPVGSVSVAPATAQLSALGETVQLNPTVRTQGGANSNAPVTWQSSAPQVATVDANGLVRAVANGTAQITASVGSVSGAADITVQQVATRVNLSRSRDSIFTGATVQLTASATDRGSAAITAPRVTWSSSDTNVATVTSAGLVTGRARGQARITARVDTASAGSDIIVRLTSFLAARDTVITGNMVVDRFEVAAGRTVTLTGDLTLRAEGAVSIDGTIRGDCRNVDIVSLTTLRLRGTVDNRCNAPGAAGMRLRLVSTAEYTLDSATVYSSGQIVITNDTTIVPAVASLGAPSTFAARASMRAPANCTLTGAIGIGAAKAPGVSGNPDGKPGSRGDPVSLFCTGDMTVRGLTVKADHGADGGDGMSDTPAVFARGASGANGGSVFLDSHGKMTVDGALLVVGNGGNGGTATSIPIKYGQAAATGGFGGEAGIAVLNAAQIVFQGNQSRIEFGRSGDGGDALAIGLKGADATIGQAAQQGSEAIARAGAGGAFFAGLRLDVSGRILRGQVQNAAGLTLRAPVGGKGGNAEVSPGNGGNSMIPLFAHGANGGNGELRPGSGGDVKLFDNRIGFGFPLGTPGGTGNGTVREGNGGFGVPDCAIPLHLGGNGGDGSKVAHHPSAPGADALGRPGPGGGKTEVIDALNGRDGRLGIPPGKGGVAGQLQPNGAPVLPDVDVGNSRHSGVSGNTCPPFATNVTTSYETGDASHVPFLALQQTTNLVITFGASGTAASVVQPVASRQAGISATIAGNQRWQPFTGPIDDAGNIDVTFTGNFAGRPNIPARFLGKILKGSDGKPSGIDGTIEVGLNGTLPGGRSTTYRVKGGTGT
jgi:hypothetical protein